MTKITTPRNDGFLQEKAVRSDWFSAFTQVFRRLNAAESTTTLSDDSVTISNPPTQAEVQAVADKLDAVINSLK